MSEQSLPITFDTFQLRVLGRQFPEAHDYWDGNWLVVEAECSDAGCYLRGKGSWLTVAEVQRLAETLDKLAAGKIREANVHPIEPNLSFRFETQPTGLVAVSVLVDPEDGRPARRVCVEIETTAIEAAVTQCRTVLASYPVRG